MITNRLEISFFLTASWARDLELPNLEMMKAVNMTIMAIMMRSSIRIEGAFHI